MLLKGLGLGGFRAFRAGAEASFGESGGLGMPRALRGVLRHELAALLPLV